MTGLSFGLVTFLSRQSQAFRVLAKLDRFPPWTVSFVASDHHALRRISQRARSAGRRLDFIAQTSRTSDRNLRLSTSTQINPCKTGAVHKLQQPSGSIRTWT